ncbi:hypothetical protein CHGG_07518 [Chaetomium globosum CBS 148.51]|uniref:Extracellular protein n=1 Tax=Chaetomium globosum (strain ATCC 6205 / CBS 148.51 / DSM 1962 / NBRC 6347 / NRRL 1970) TaxID=306901 RepID=Q2GWY6_CHAGB|nr:uncharacterized protein CHGG_07518 [Chaetomium globosum CBS 148.51]EAQ86265.1 hypothetical protein CHGG_07518 [Chaetomium globosum CBS 148.51]
MTNLLHLLALTLAAAGTTTAHMQMSYPPPLKSQSNPNTGPSGADYSMTSPLKADGSDFPCKGYLPLLHTPQGRAVASWTPGQTYNFTITGGAAHGGGSCQAAISVDGGASFRVVHSYEGGCPGQGESSFQFVVPGDTPRTEGAVFAWTWFNHLGNREMYMNCAVVDIVGGGGGAGGSSAKVAFASRPGLFTANIGNGCQTVDSADVKFPDPGPDVDSGAGATPPTGSCGGGAASGGGRGSGSAPTPPSTQVVPPCASTTSAKPMVTVGECESEPNPTQMPGTDGSATGYTPGNDWPDWFQSNAPEALGPVYLIVSAWMMLVAYLLA